MSDSFSLFQQQIDQALSLVENASVIKGQQLPKLTGKELVDTQSLLNRCEKVCDKHSDNKPTIRIIHHLACSGGTLISKCISAMPNVCLLSEVHPLSNRSISLDNPKFSPTDIPSLVKYSQLPNQEATIKRIFKESVSVVVDESQKNGMDLILRYHSHSDFHSGDVSSTTEILEETLSGLFNISSVYTIRNPIDSYISLKKNGWVHFRPATFDEYCHRYIFFLKEVDVSRIVKYEDFVSNPLRVMGRICEMFDLNLYSDFELMYDYIKLTGDSGRHSHVIKERQSNATQEVIEDAIKSKNYSFICNKYGYPILDGK